MPGLLFKAPNVEFPDRCLGPASDCPERPPPTPFSETISHAGSERLAEPSTFYSPQTGLYINLPPLKQFRSPFFSFVRLQEPASIPNEPYPRLALFSAVRETSGFRCVSYGYSPRCPGPIDRRRPSADVMARPLPMLGS